ncbi:MAG: hypothetical protein K2X54_11460 [Methylobacterium organophilum]|nr:hypothetical protein [Methylobacterium organophilum]
MTATTKPGDHEARARLRAIESIRRNLPAFIETRVKSHVETQDLLAGFEFQGGSAYADMDHHVRFWLDGPHKLPERLRKPLERLQEFPSKKTAQAVRREIARIEAGADRDSSKVLFQTRQGLRDLAERCDVWAAEWGDPDAARRCASKAFKAWSYSATGYAWASAQGWGYLRQWIAYTEASNTIPADFVDRDPTERAEDHAAFLPVLRELHRTLDVVLEALDAGPIEEEQPKPAESSEPPPANDGFADFLLDYDRAGIVKDDPAARAIVEEETARIAALEEITRAPRLMVLESVEHLPKSGGSGRSDARKDGEPIAGKRLRLRQAGDLADMQIVLDAEFPHLRALTNRILTTQVGLPWTKLPPILLVGAPGIAKTRYARRIGEVLDLKPAVHPTTGLPDGMFAGLSRGWSNGMPCAPIQAIIASKIANPMLIMDEIEKIGTSKSYGSLHDVLLNMLEPESAKRYTDVYFNCPVDISAVNFMMTANSLAGVPQPLLDRCTIVSVPAPGPEHLEALAGSILDDLRRERGQDEAWCPDLDGVEMQALREHWAGGSLRVLRQLVAAVLTTRDATAPRQ